MSSPHDSSVSSVSSCRDESAKPTSRRSAAAFSFVFITVALDMLALGVMIPVLMSLGAALVVAKDAP